MKFIKFTTLNKHWLNFLMLLKDGLIIYANYYIVSMAGALVLSVAKSKPQVLEVVGVYESLIGTLFLLTIVFIPVFAILLNLEKPSGMLSSLRKVLNKFVSKRRSIILFGLFASLHVYSDGMERLSHHSIGDFTPQLLQLSLAMLLLRFFIAEGKERYLGYLFYVSKSNSSFLTLEGDFTPYAKENITFFDECGTKNLECPFVQGEVKLNVRCLLTPISRKFVKTPDGHYHFVNSRYIDALFALHKIAMFFKGIRKAIKYQSPAAIRSIMKHEVKVMTAKQRQIYALILLVLVSVLSNYFYYWLGR
ncbi:MAG: hypothetical protein FWH31_04890 [Streptococcaceae bacterium]|nr:hypothetical protein [Streptococcaceae bacterium]